MDRKKQFGMTSQIHTLFQNQASKISFYNHGITDVSIPSDPVQNSCFSGSITEDRCISNLHSKHPTFSLKPKQAPTKVSGTEIPNHIARIATKVPKGMAAEEPFTHRMRFIMKKSAKTILKNKIRKYITIFKKE